jgi:hypothetical protein
MATRNTGIRTGKNIILPDIEMIRDAETKRILKEMIKVMRDMNFNSYNDLTRLQERIEALEL